MTWCYTSAIGVYPLETDNSCFRVERIRNRGSYDPTTDRDFGRKFAIDGGKIAAEAAAFNEPLTPNSTLQTSCLTAYSSRHMGPLPLVQMHHATRPLRTAGPWTLPTAYCSRGLVLNETWGALEGSGWHKAAKRPQHASDRRWQSCPSIKPLTGSLVFGSAPATPANLDFIVQMDAELEMASVLYTIADHLPLSNIRTSDRGSIVDLGAGATSEGSFLLYSKMRFSTIPSIALVGVAAASPAKRATACASTADLPGQIAEIVADYNNGADLTSEFASIISSFTSGTDGTGSTLFNNVYYGDETVDYAGEVTTALKDVATTFADESISQAIDIAINIVGQVEGIYNSYEAGNVTAADIIDDASTILSELEQMYEAYMGEALGSTTASDYSTILNKISSTVETILSDYSKSSNSVSVASLFGSLNSLSAEVYSFYAALAGETTESANTSFDFEGLVGTSLDFLQG
ncbi:hypothetical protein BX600DRAFT_439263 [Xylariales sp. PMI_506]|nr:hypothetical protein BX600DRAFT_439263 [Xylariales sp. PMI_506]